MNVSILSELETIERRPVGNARLEALKKADAPKLRELLSFALSPQITFGVKKLPAVEGPIGELFLTDYWWYEDLRALCLRLQDRELTGHAAQEAITDHLGKCSKLQRKWSERVLRQDLRLNIGPKEVNNVLGAGTIFSFDVPLATDYKKVKPAELRGSWFVQPKYDGARVIAHLPHRKGRVALYSRTGKEWKNFEPVRAKLQQISDLWARNEDFWLDGEVVALDAEGRVDFQALQAALFRKDGLDVANLKYLVFDGAHGREWSNPQLPYSVRLQYVTAQVRYWIEDVSGTTFRLGAVPTFKTENPTVETMQKHSEGFVTQGFEGAMYRRSEAPVRMKRTRDLLKVKIFLDMEAEITDCVEGTGKYRGMLGALKVTDGGRKFEVGSGFSDLERKCLWDLRGNLAGRIITIKYQEKTEDGLPRFPIWRGFRPEGELLPFD